MTGSASRLPPRAPARSRDLLLDAAQLLFAERGFDRTTVREIGERAGVDPALIARHFGSKAGLYLAALRAELGDEVPADLLEPGRLRDLLARLGRRGTGPVFQAVVRAHDDGGPRTGTACRSSDQRMTQAVSVGPACWL